MKSTFLFDLLSITIYSFFRQEHFEALKGSIE